jgi:hypothetical protein
LHTLLSFHSGIAPGFHQRKSALALWSCKEQPLSKNSTVTGRFPDERNYTMWNQIYRSSDVKAKPAPFPDTKGNPTMQVLNADPVIGPGLLRIVMEPGDVIARHFHAGQAETPTFLKDLSSMKGRFILRAPS